MTVSHGVSSSLQPIVGRAHLPSRKGRRLKKRKWGGRGGRDGRRLGEGNGGGGGSGHGGIQGQQWWWHGSQGRRRRRGWRRRHRSTPFIGVVGRGMGKRHTVVAAAPVVRRLGHAFRCHVRERGRWKRGDREMGHRRGGGGGVCEEPCGITDTVWRGRLVTTRNRRPGRRRLHPRRRPVSKKAGRVTKKRGGGG